MQPPEVSPSTFALATILDLRLEAGAPLNKNDRDRDLLFARLIDDYSLAAEQACGFRLLMRGAQTSGIVTAATLANGALTIAAQPASPGRVLTCTITSGSDVSAGTVTFVGTDPSGAAVTETYDIATFGRWWHGTKVFTTLTSVTVAGLSDAGASDTVAVGSMQAYTEYHTILHGDIDHVFTRCAPVGTLIDAYEDDDRVYAAADLLTLDTDYIVDNARGLVTRVSGGDTIDFLCGPRVLRLRYSGGFGNDERKARVPARLKSIMLQAAVARLRSIDQKFGERVDPTGTVTKFPLRGATNVSFTPDQIRAMRPWLRRQRNMPETVYGVD